MLPRPAFLPLAILMLATPASHVRPTLAAENRPNDEQLWSEAETRIEQHRKTDATILVTDAAGTPVEGAEVQIEQTRHAFLFGCNIYMFDRYRNEVQNAAYKQRFAELFNYATVGFYWRWYEPQRGKPNYEYTDKVVAWCQDHGIRMKGHPLLWGDQAGVPTWSPGQPAPEIQRQRVTEIMQRYRGKIEFWAEDHGLAPRRRLGRGSPS